MQRGVNRREVLGMGAAAVLGAPAIGRIVQGAAADPEIRPAPAATGRRSIRKALKYGMIVPGTSVRDKFAIARDAGFDGVELDSPNDLDADEVLRARDDTGLAIPGVVDSVHWTRPLSDPDAAVRAEGLRGLETAIRDCKAYGGTTVLLVPAVVRKSVSYAEAYIRSQSEIRKAIPLAAEMGVHIAIENVWNHFLLSPLEAARYVDEFESPAIGWYFDVGNVVNFGWPEHWIRILGRRLLRVDVKEYSRARRDQQGLWRGFEVDLMEGDCDWPIVMRALDEIGYGGWATAEVAGGDAARLAAIADRMDRIIAA